MTVYKLLYSSIILILINHFSLGFIPVFKTKELINIDLSSELPEQVIREALVDDVITWHYSIDPRFDEHYKIGEIRNDGVLVSENRPMAVRRRVSMVINPFGTIYLQIDNIYITHCGEVEKEIEELIKEPDDHVYGPVNRTPITLDLENLPHIPNFINAKRDRSGGTKYTVHHLLRQYITIGQVKYGEHIIDGRVDDVIYKCVVAGIDPMGRKLVVIITTVARDATLSTTVYEIKQQENGLPFSLQSHNALELF